jgi:hypothetical protein
MCISAEGKVFDKYQCVEIKQDKKSQSIYKLDVSNYKLLGSHSLMMEAEKVSETLDLCSELTQLIT